jgi:hypothetical protein
MRLPVTAWAMVAEAVFGNTRLADNTSARIING